MGSSQLRRGLANVAAVGVGLGLALALVEGLARVATRPDPALAYATRSGEIARAMCGRFYQHDPDLGWRHRAGVSGAFDAPDFHTTVTLDGDGHRVLPPPPAAARPTRRVLVLGDSVAFGWGVDAADTFAARLAAARPDLAVANLAVSGYGTDQELLALRRALAEIVRDRTIPTPTTVVVTFYLNDLLDNAAASRWGYRKPRFELAADGTLALTGVPVPSPSTDAAAHADLDDLLAAHWRSYALVRPRVTNLLVRLGAVSAAEGVDDYLGCFARARAAEREPLWRLWSAIMDRMAAEARAAGVDLLVLVVPVRTQVVAPARARLADRYGYRDADLDLDEPERRIAAWGRAARVPVATALEPLRAAAAGASPYFTLDLHPNARGHAAVADLLARAISR